MSAHRLAPVGWLLILGLCLSACAPRGGSVPSPADGPERLQGEFRLTEPLPLHLCSDQTVALVDMYGFVARDAEWEIPPEGRIPGRLELAEDRLSGRFALDLPIRPQGRFHDLDRNGREDAGVQVFAVACLPDPFEGTLPVEERQFFGWPGDLASVVTDRGHQNEIAGGDLLIWAPDGGQRFPSGFGADGLLFTADDPLMSVPAGWSQVNLDREPFAVLRQPILPLTLHRPRGVEPVDLSTLGYLDAYDRMFARVRVEYAFNGVAGKQPDWEALDARVRPLVEQAESGRDRRAYYLALRELQLGFQDARVFLEGGADYFNQLFDERAGGGYGFAVRELDDGRLLVFYVLPGGPAEQAGLQVGAELLAVNGEQVARALERVQPFPAPFSNPAALRYQQVRYLLRAPLKSEVAFTVRQPDGEMQTVRLEAVSEWESFNLTSIYRDRPADFDSLLPVEYRFLDPGTGYIRLNGLSADPLLSARLFAHALRVFESKQVDNLILDLRYTRLDAPLGLAGFLTEREIDLGRLERYDRVSGRFEPQGPRLWIRPRSERYSFERLALLVGPACAGACEVEAWAFSRIPGAAVVGQYPTAGSWSLTEGGGFLLPDGFRMRFPTGRYRLADGSLLLEGQGVPLTVRIPLDETTTFQSGDLLLQAAQQTLLQPAGMGVKPAGSPQLADPAQGSAMLPGATLLEDRAREPYAPERTEYTIVLAGSEPLIWTWGWCALTPETLAENLQHIRLDFILNGESLPLERFAVLDQTQDDGQVCRRYYTVLSGWPPGEHRLQTVAVFDQPVHDGLSEHPAGQEIISYTVYVQP